jgi:uncharacterized membrane protein
MGALVAALIAAAATVYLALISFTPRWCVAIGQGNLQLGIASAGVVVMAWGWSSDLFLKRSTKEQHARQWKFDRTLLWAVVGPVLSYFDSLVWLSALILIAVIWSLLHRSASRRLSDRVVATLDGEGRPDAERVEHDTARQVPESVARGKIDRSVVRIEEYDSDNRPKKTLAGIAIRERANGRYLDTVRTMQQSFATLVLGVLLMFTFLAVVALGGDESVLVIVIVTVVVVLVLAVAARWMVKSINNPRAVTSLKVLLFWRNVEIIAGILVLLMVWNLTRWVALESDGFLEDWVLVTLGIATFAVFLANRWRNGRRIRDRMTETSPFRLSVLWAFDSVPEEFKLDMQQMIYWLRDDWQFVGDVRLLRGPGFLISDVMDLIRPSSWTVLTTPDQVRTSLGAEHLPVRAGMTDTWRTFPARSILCHDSVWQGALDLMLADSDAILMDLRGFSRDNEGCVREIDALFDRVSVQRLIFVSDETVNRRLLRSTFGRAWARMSSSSPNHDVSGAEIKVLFLEQEEEDEEKTKRKGIGCWLPVQATLALLAIRLALWGLRYLFGLNAPYAGENRRFILRDTDQARDLNTLLCEAAATSRPDPIWANRESIRVCSTKAVAIVSFVVIGVAAGFLAIQAV